MSKNRKKNCFLLVHRVAKNSKMNKKLFQKQVTSLKPVIQSTGTISSHIKC